MTHCPEFASPVMRAATRFHDQTARLPCEKLEKLRSNNPLAEQLSPGGISAVRLKNRLRNVQTDRA
jgi:hypothetical protein